MRKECGKQQTEGGGADTELITDIELCECEGVTVVTALANRDS
jgi:hypothetical protein